MKGGRICVVYQPRTPDEINAREINASREKNKGRKCRDKTLADFSYDGSKDDPDDNNTILVIIPKNLQDSDEDKAIQELAKKNFSHKDIKLKNSATAIKPASTRKIPPAIKPPSTRKIPPSPRIV